MNRRRDPSDEASAVYECGVVSPFSREIPQETHSSNPADRSEGVLSMSSPVENTSHFYRFRSNVRSG